MNPTCQNHADHQFVDDPPVEAWREKGGLIWYRTRRVCQLCGFVDYAYTTQGEIPNMSPLHQQQIATYSGELRAQRRKRTLQKLKRNYGHHFGRNHDSE